MLFSGLKESSQQEITLSPSIKYDEFECVLHYIYTKNVDAVLEKIANDSDSSLILGVYDLACVYQLKKLQSELELTLALSITPENVCSTLLLAHQRDSHALLLYCHLFIKQHLEEVKQTEDYLLNHQVVDEILRAHAWS